MIRKSAGLFYFYKMKRILVIGSGGAGKTTFARLLSKKFGFPLIHLDAHFWNPGWTKTPTEEWNQIVHELCSKPEWVMDGYFAINSRPRTISALNNRTAPIKIHTIANRRELKRLLKELENL